MAQDEKDDSPCCRNCKFAISETSTDLRSTTYCRRFPPVATMLQGPRGQVMNMSSFPTVAQNAWCGEFQPKGLVLQ